MTPEETYGKLIAALQEVARKKDAGDDYWRYSAMRTVTEFFRAIGIDAALRAPFVLLRLEMADAWCSKRREAERLEGRTLDMPKNLSRSLVLSLAVAAAATLKSGQHIPTMRAAMKAVADASAIDHDLLENFRKNLSSRSDAAGERRRDEYRSVLKGLSGWSKEEVLYAVTGLSKILTDPSH